MQPERQSIVIVLISNECPPPRPPSSQFEWNERKCLRKGYSECRSLVKLGAVFVRRYILLAGRRGRLTLCGALYVEPYLAFGFLTGSMEQTWPTGIS